ncbi:TRAP transporter large permease [Aquibaculum sediminis]|uniref:TRAP transporter large permease n=1 Tax=Aquibaculum sediminis TaxID=3231907 RepID=UPI003451ED65
MDRTTIGIIGVAVVLLMILLRVPVGIALGLVSIAGIFAILGLTPALGAITAIPFNFIGDWSLSAIPMFLLMGAIASKSEITADLFQFMRMLLNRVPGGLASASVGACALFSAASGSSLATAGAMTRVAIPEMLRANYSPALATGTVAAAGTLGSLIPPSILMIIYGIFAEQSISMLFAASFLPGVVSALLFVAMITTRSYLNPSIAPPDKTVYTSRQKLQALRGVWPFPLIIIAILGGIFSGIFSPTEAGAAGAFFALLLAMWRRTFSIRDFYNSLIDTANTTASIFIIGIGAILFTRFMAIAGIPSYLSQALEPLIQEPTLLIIMIGIMFIILGMFVDSIGLLLLTLPILLPIVKQADINLIWFGVVAVKLLEIGMITPPLGLNVYVIKGAIGKAISLGTIFKGCYWFIVMDLLLFAAFIAFPSLVMFVPNLLMR